MTLCWTGLIALLLQGPPPPGFASPIRDLPPQPFEQVRKRLESVRGGTVSSVCGSAFAPWGYRGRQADHILRPYHTGEVDRRWARAFVDALMRSDDWGSIHQFRGLSKPCDRRHDAPLFVVSLRRTGWTVYVLISFEGRSAQVFESGRRLGSVRLGDRADSLFAMIQRALPDSIVRAMPSAPPADTTVIDSPGLYAAYPVDSLPHVLDPVGPLYPPGARAEGIQGVVEVQALVGTDGRVQDAYVDTSIPALDDAALDAVWQWKFKPAMAAGRPVAVWIRAPVRFRLH